MSSFAFFAGPPASPAIPDALPIPQVFVEPLVLCWAGGLLCLQIVLQMLFKFSSSKKMSENAGVVAHQLVVSIPFGYAAYMGVKLLYFDDKIAAMTASANYADRLYGFHATCWEMTRFFVGFQLYDLCVTLIVPSLWGPDHIAHHTLSLLTACAGTSGPNLMWYCPFFFGVVEVSSVPLGWVDLFRHVPPAKGTFLSAVNEVVRIAFAVSFLPIRCVMFPYYIFGVLYTDLYAAFLADDIRKPIALGWFAFSGTVLMCMQLFWGQKIVRILYKQFVGKEKAGDRKKEK